MAASVMKRILSSPNNHKNQSMPSENGKRKSTGVLRYFSVPLDEILLREGNIVPNIITKIASIIIEKGLDQEGIFRVNGNAKVIEKLRTAYDRNGDANMSNISDIMAVASLLKLFLRELPDTLIPAGMTQKFLAAQEMSVKDPKLSLAKIRELIKMLPFHNYASLKYLMAFVVLVAREEKLNKMNSNSLSTIFGPNVFRCTAGFVGLKEQGVTNYITLQFITKYSDLFLEDGEISPNDPGFTLQNLLNSLNEKANTVQNIGTISSSVEKTDEEDTDEDDSVDRGSISLQQSRYSEPIDAAKSSEFILSSTIMEAISKTIREYVFNGSYHSGSDSDDTLEDADERWNSSEEEKSERKKVQKQQTMKYNLGEDAESDSDDDVEDVSDSSESSDGDAAAGDNNRIEVESGAINRHRMMHAGDGRPTKPVLNDPRQATKGNGRLTHPHASETRIFDADEELNSGDGSHRPTSVPPSTKDNSKLATSAKHGRKVDHGTSSNRIVPVKTQPVEKQQAWSVTVTQQPVQPSSPRLDSNQPKHSRKGKPNESHKAQEMNDDVVSFKQLTKKIHACKQKIRDFEQEFESENGYKPSHQDRNSQPEIRNCIKELSAARQQLNELREQPVDPGRDDLNADRREAAVHPPKIEDTFSILMRRLKEKREEAGRPEDLAKMSMAEIADEKLCIQKVLLQFESIHGRPNRASEKEIMLPLYDRYRQIKRRLTRSSVSDDEGPEYYNHDQVNQSFVSSCTQSTAATGFISKKSSSHSSKNNVGPISPSKHQESVNGYKDGVRPRAQPEVTHAVRQTSEDFDSREDTFNFNHLSTPQLLSELQRTRTEKKRLQIVLHDFEEAFRIQNGRKIQKLDQLPKESDYRLYKRIKAKLKLLEVLAAKRQNASK